MEDESRVYTLNYALADEGLLHLDGPWDQTRIKVTLRKQGPLLINRGFHWLQETPFNK